MSARHLAPAGEQTTTQSAGETCARAIAEGAEPCRFFCDHGGNGRHLAIPRHPVRWPSSSQAGLASFRDAWANDPDRTTRRETFA